MPGVNVGRFGGPGGVIDGSANIVRMSPSITRAASGGNVIDLDS